MPQGVDEGKLWSLIRAVLSQGQAQQQDYAEGKHSGYEAFSARVDLAARERVPAFLALLSAAPPPDAPDLGSSRSVASSGVGPECPTAVARPSCDECGADLRCAYDWHHRAFAPSPAAVPLTTEGEKS